MRLYFLSVPVQSIAWKDSSLNAHITCYMHSVILNRIWLTWVLFWRVQLWFLSTEDGLSLPTKATEEFRPFMRQLPEFKFWFVDSFDFCSGTRIVWLTYKQIWCAVFLSFLAWSRFKLSNVCVVYFETSTFEICLLHPFLFAMLAESYKNPWELVYDDTENLPN